MDFLPEIKFEFENIFNISLLLHKFLALVSILLLFLLWYALDRFVRRLLRHVFTKAAARIETLQNDEISRENVKYRMSTICALLTEVSRMILGLVMIFWILSSMGVDLRPVLAGIGVVGLAVSLAAQNTIRDFISGFIILFEDQYNIGDWIETENFSGTVEVFSLRATRLRDLNGNLIIIPNSTIQTVRNYSKGWSTALVKVGITYESDYQKARSIMLDLADEMKKHESSLITGEPDFQGITNFGDNAIEMRILIKTVPGRQWMVEREYREKLKERFDAAGVSFAYPQIVIHKS